MTTPADDLRTAMQEAGIPTNDAIVADKELHRVHVVGDRRGSRSGWYVLHPDEPAAGAFGCWKRGISETWSAANGANLSGEDLAQWREKINEQRKTREAEQQKARERAREKAARMWSEATAPDPDHPYLRAKAVGVHGIRQLGDQLLVRVVGPDGGLRGLQRILPDGTKRFIAGTEVSGAYFPIGGTPDDELVVTEGYSTGATVHEATSRPVAVAFNAGNLAPTARALRAKLGPDVRLVIAADDDHATEGNPGLTAAREAAATVGGAVVAPQFTNGRRGTDFNDLMLAEGIEAVTNAFNATDNDDAEAPVRLEDFHAYMPGHSYIFEPTRDMWPASSVNARIPPVEDGDGDPVKASAWLDKNRPVEQMTWAPGDDVLIEGRLIDHGGWIPHPGARTFNLYRPPRIAPGDAARAAPWLDHIRKVYPDDASHIIRWLAHRVQRPDEKVNHALVLQGPQGTGKDTVVEGVVPAVGPWNVAEVAPEQVLGRFNPHVKSVILRLSEARDLGDHDRYRLYDHTKTLIAAPPAVLRVDEKHIREYAVPNVVGVIITTNHRDGIYLPADDRRHYVAWTDLTKEDFEEDYWARLYQWYAKGGFQHVAAFLHDLDLSGFNPKAPPPKTDAFWAVVDAGRAPEDAELATVLDRLQYPPAITLGEIAEVAEREFAEWLQDRRNARKVPHRMEDAGYVKVRNEDAKDGLWKVAGRRQVVYALRELSKRDRIAAAQRLMEAVR